MTRERPAAKVTRGIGAEAEFVNSVEARVTARRKMLIQLATVLGKGRPYSSERALPDSPLIQRCTISSLVSESYCLHILVTKAPDVAMTS